MSLRVINNIDNISKDRWADFVFQHTNGNIFQSPEMFEVYKNIKNYEPIFLAAINEQGEILEILVAVIQREVKGVLGFLTARSIIWEVI